ncbi:hypothetical protein ES702_04254 [subsurface metagenome]
MRSPITGDLQVYVLTNSFGPYGGHSTEGLDPAEAKASLNEYYQTQEIDAVCDKVKVISSPVVDYVLVDNWLPGQAMTLSDGTVTFVIPVIIVVAVKAALALIIHYLVPLAVVVAIAWAFKEYVYEPMMYPKHFYAYDSTGPYTREEAYTYNAAQNPGMYVDPGTTIVIDPTLPGAEEWIEYIKSYTPPGWGLPSIGNIVPILIIGAVIVGVIVLGPPLLDMLKRE